MAEVQSKEKELREKKDEEVLRKEEFIERADIQNVEKIEREDEIKKKEEKEPTEKDSKEMKLTIIFKKKPLRILLLLLQNKKWYPSLLARESGQSYVHATKIINALEGLDLVVSDSSGKKKIITLTEKGEKLVKSIEEVTRNL